MKPSQAIGKGGEADVFEIAGNKAVKVFKQSNHPDYQGLPEEQQMAIARLAVHQTKLQAFPQNLPNRIIKPEQLATDRWGKKILGYTMPLLKGVDSLLKYSDRNFRNVNGISNQVVINIFQNLHETVKQIHAQNVVIGDFNDLNILVLKDEAYLIDADSFQYGQYSCQVFTQRFVDPLLCDPLLSKPELVRSHNPNSDWYAFAVMLMQSLLFVDPYGGVYKPKASQVNSSGKVLPKILHEGRSLHRITVFHPDVKYPKPAIPYGVLPDDLLNYFHRCFIQDQRGEFPNHLLANLHWSKCSGCGIEYARNTCPICRNPLLSMPIIPIQGINITVTQIFQTEGVILQASLQGDRLHWLSYEQGEFKREDGNVILKGDLGSMRVWLHGKSTLVGKQGQVITLGEPNSRLAVDSYRDLPMCDRNSYGRYWLHNGQLMRDGLLGSEYIGDVLINQTQFWVGEHFGFGFYRAGNLQVAFVFDAKGQSLNDNVKLPSWNGELIAANCVFSEKYCWLSLAIQANGTRQDLIYMISATGEVIAESSSHDFQLSNIHGSYAVGNFLLIATDEGIIKLEPQGRKVIKVKDFLNTEPYIDANCQIFASKQGLYAVSDHEILKIVIL
ncbi:hypothetical protein [Synechococcus sp. PCC 7502]|uniref:hypothetical protein n=1 Tax=Synechococcus sp. PCC 7502 TaxID=1173263 RepID=UPI0003052170|nr:hypothetical protein [Synechococcus sp. PCC 7502]